MKTFATILFVLATVIVYFFTREIVQLFAELNPSPEQIHDLKQLLNVMFTVITIAAFIILGILFHKSEHLELKDICDGKTVYEVMCACVYSSGSADVIIRKFDSDDAETKLLKIHHTDCVEYDRGAGEFKGPNIHHYYFNEKDLFRCENDEDREEIKFIFVDRPAPAVTT